MFTLIKREIQDHILYLIGSTVLTAILIVALTTFAFQQDTRIDWDDLIAPVIPLAIITMLGFCAMGVSQMYTDRNRRISAFVSTLPVTRTQILFARIATGILTILILLIPLIITITILIRWFEPPIPMYAGIIFNISLTTFLMMFTCYCIGLLTGWNPSKVIPTFGALVLTCILMPLVMIKGFGWEIAMILAAFIAALLIRTWQTFTSTSL
ncbi:MAG: ABC-2 transporter permease [Sedimentisphaerales bacterium]|nr:ABC-2 transporter permease [Sedimentisphaerales bacterium]